MLNSLLAAILVSIFALAILAVPSDAQTISAASVATIADYNALLPTWGTSWSAGSKSVGGYYPTFYTGFAMRSEFPERIHVRVARGNQTRLSVILDEVTIGDYLFDLTKRYEFYKKVTSGTNASIDIKPSGGKFLPQLDYFNQVVESPTYGILALVDRANRNRATESELYKKSLQILSDLNPGRVFFLHLDLTASFRSWKKDLRKTSTETNKILANPVTVVATLNSLVFGRINLTQAPSPAILAKLRRAVDSALADENEEIFVAAAFDLFKLVTGSKYDFLTVDENGDWQPAAKCESARTCKLAYPEFTAIYPTGSLEGKTSDENGNRINAFATPGLWQFLNYSGREVDNIRDEPYYGFAPKMDYEGIGNGFHNPAVRFWGPSKDLKKALGIDASHNTLWAAKRGGVSHGCLRLPIGHLWEMRQIFPVENSKMTQISFFGNNSQDFDVYDIDGDGQLEVMGVQYMISYGLKGTDGLARREGTNFEINADKKLSFYKDLYGESKVFEVENDRYFFVNPKVSFPSHLDLRKKSVKTRLALSGRFPLYEQTYEKDKIQFYAAGAMTPATKKLVRLMGRVRGCAPANDKKTCGEEAFDREAAEVVR